MMGDQATLVESPGVEFVSIPAKTYDDIDLAYYRASLAWSKAPHSGTNADQAVRFKVWAAARGMPPV